MTSLIERIMTLAKVPLIILKGVVLIKALTPPNTASNSEQVEAKGFERVFKHMLGVPLIISKTAFLTDAIIETSCVLAAAFPSSPLARRILATLTPSENYPLHVFTPSASWFLGMFLLLSGGLFRLSAFRTLGRHFTFDLAVLKDHKLITSGAYRYVRHPSYTGLIGMMWGTTITIGSTGSWTREVLWNTMVGQRPNTPLPPGWLLWARVFGAVMVVGQGVVLAGIAARTRMEDEMLHKEFGKQWEDWANVTKWKLLPGIY